MFIHFTHSTGEAIVVNATLVLTAQEYNGSVTLKMSNGDFVPVKADLGTVLRKLNEARLS